MKIRTDLVISGEATFSASPILPASDPTSGNHAVRKYYVDHNCNYHYFSGLKVYTTANNSDFDTRLSASIAAIQLSDGKIYTNLNLSSLDYTNPNSVGVLNGIRGSVLAYNTQYYLFVISNGSDIGLWLDFSRTSPAFPTGYYIYRWISSPITSIEGSARFDNFYQYNRWYYFHGAWPNQILENGSATSKTAINCANFIPPEAVAVTVWWWANSTTWDQQVWYWISGAYSGLNIDNVYVCAENATQNGTATFSLWTAQTIYYYCTLNPGSLQLVITGYEISLGEPFNPFD